MISRLGIAALIALPLYSATAAPRVVVSIKPLQGIVAGIMDGIARPHLLLPGGASPHSYSLKPSDARALRRAQVIIWIGPELETFLVKPLRVLGGGARRITLTKLRSLIRHQVRAGGLWERHDHDSHGEHGSHKGHDHKDQGHKDHGHKDHGKAHKHGGQLDGHIWMDPRNGMLFARAVAGALTKADPANAGRYRANLAATLERIRAADRRARAILAPVRRRPYIVFHDAFQYFEKRYGLRGAGSITLEGRSPGARRLYNIRSRILKQRVRCVFTEPQFPPKLAKTVVAGTPAKLGEVDPVGATLPGNKGDYARLLVNAASSISGCLK